MTKDSNKRSGAAAFEAENAGGLLSGILAEESVLDRRTLWRIGSWGVGAVGAVTLAILSHQSSIGWRQEQVASADLTRQAQQIQSLTKESQNETRRLAAAIDTLNNDRDRLYARVTVLEQGLDSVTGTIAHQKAAAEATAALPQIPSAAAAPSPQSRIEARATPAAPPAPVIAAVAATPAAATEKPHEAAKSDNKLDNKPQKQHAEAIKPEKPAVVAMAKPEQPTVTAIPATPPSPSPSPVRVAEAAPVAAASKPLVESKSMMGPPDPAAPKLVSAAKMASATEPPKAEATKPPLKQASAAPTAKEAPSADVQQTKFAVDLGSANSVPGLRALWRGLLKSNGELAELHPIIVVKEGNTGLGMQLRLAAGPLTDAAAAARICVEMMEKRRPCEPTVFDGQRLAMTGEEGADHLEAAKPAARTYRHYATRHVKKEEPLPAPPPPPPPPSTFSSLFGFNRH